MFQCLLCSKTLQHLNDAASGYFDQEHHSMPATSLPMNVYFWHAKDIFNI